MTASDDFDATETNDDLGFDSPDEEEVDSDDLDLDELTDEDDDEDDDS